MKIKEFFENGVESRVKKVSVLLIWNCTSILPARICRKDVRHMNQMPKTSMNGKVRGRFFFAAFFSRMTNLLLFTMACLLFGRLTRGGYWEEMGVTCDLEPHDVTVCGTKVQMKRCRGTCRSISRITMGFPYYRKYCQCCQGNKFTDKTVSCAGGGHKKIRYPAGCSCQNC